MGRGTLPLALALLLGALGGVPATPDGPPGGALPDGVPAPQRGETVLVFAAHPDDESLGAGGYIHAAVAAGARVTLVIFTNGDGYLEGVDVGFHTLFSTPQRFIQYGMLRQREALEAAGQLGVPASQVIFLSYPDRGLAALWGPRWGCTHPYRSPFTRRDRSPYPRTYRPGARYCGEDVLADLASILRAARPSVIVVHHPEDTHRDHWAAEAFVTTAVEQLASEGEAWAQRVHVLHYLVHHGPWPSPRTYAPDLPLSPPSDLWVGSSRWERFPLGEADEDAKRRALFQYHTQMQLLRSFLLSFVRTDEPFDLSSGLLPERLRDEEAPPLAAPELWDRFPSVLRLPASGSLLRAAEPGATVEGLAVAWTGERLLLAVRLKRPALREIQYRIDLRLVYLGGRIARLALRFRPPAGLVAERASPDMLPLPPGAAAHSFGRRIHVLLPLGTESSAPEAALLHLVTVGPLGTVLDRVPWTVVRLRPAPERGRRE
jgi:LmbE family N-acetylglucosaminyl deacetylase